MASMIFKKEPFFQGADNNDQLVRITKVLGTDDLNKCLNKYKLELDPEIAKLIVPCPKKPWQKFINPDNKHLCGEDAIDLLSKMLLYDHAERITPRDAMEHKYFDPVRKIPKSETSKPK